MHFDDRLATVLRQRAAGERAARTQYRQLLDLLGQRTGNSADELEESGWERLSNLSGQISSRERATILREGGWRFRNPALILFLADQEAEVAASALSVVELASEDWALLIPELPIRARGFLRLRRDLPQAANEILDRLGVHDRALPAPQGMPASVREQPLSGGSDALLLVDEPDDGKSAAPSARVPPLERNEDDAPHVPAAEPSVRNDRAGSASAAEGDKIGALVRRIEAFQEARRAAGAAPVAERERAYSGGTSAPVPDAPIAPSPTPIEAFAFATDIHGAISWADADAAPMVIGTSLVGLAQALDDAEDLQLALMYHLPLRHVVAILTGAASIQGRWVIDAVPSFARDGGSFQGYVGRFARPVDQATARATTLQDRADRLRQLLHELRTPVNAMQGFAELIQQEVVGRTPHAYRALAAAIGGDSARILSGFDDLDRMVRLESGMVDLAEGHSAIHEIVAATVRQLRLTLQARGAGFDLLIRAAETVVPVAQADAELLLWRILAATAAGAADGEVVDVQLLAQAQTTILSCGLSSGLRERTDVFATDFRLHDDVVSSGIFGAGFALRLARAEARSVGGDLRRDDARLVLTLPAQRSASGSSTRSALAA